MTDNPAALLRRAAALIRSLGEHVSPGPWMTSNSRTHWLADDVVFGQSVSMANRISQVCNVDYGQNRKPDAAWIALMHPGVGAALAEWLDTVAGEMTAVEGTEYRAIGNGHDFESWNAALAVAHALLGEAAE